MVQETIARLEAAICGGEESELMAACGEALGVLRLLNSYTLHPIETKPNSIDQDRLGIDLDSK